MRVDHTIDPDKYRQYLERKGWTFDRSLYAWVTPEGISQSQAERDRAEATLAAVVCPFNHS